jgi:hypothetical protein
MQPFHHLPQAFDFGLGREQIALQLGVPLAQVGVVAL